MSEVKEGKIKVQIPETSNFWGPKKEGECLAGLYCKKEHSTFRGRKNTIYSVKSPNHPIRDKDDMVKFYGTVVLNDVLGKIRPGYEVEIVYRGEQPSKDPKKKPTKLFDVRFWVDPKDPILQQIYPDGLPAEVQEKIDALTDSRGAAGDDHEPEKSPTLNTHDNEEIRTIVDGIEADLRDKNLKVIKLNMMTEAKDQCGGDRDYLKLVLDEIRSRGYPVRGGAV